MLCLLWKRHEFQHYSVVKLYGTRAVPASIGEDVTEQGHV